MQVVCELHKIQATIQTIICRRYTEFSLSSDFRHSIAGFAGVFAASFHAGRLSSKIRFHTSNHWMEKCIWDSRGSMYGNG